MSFRVNDVLIGRFSVMACLHCTGPGTGQGRETMGFYNTLCTVHTTQRQGRETIVFYFVHPVHCPYPGPV